MQLYTGSRLLPSSDTCKPGSRGVQLKLCKPPFIPSLLLNLPLQGFSTHSDCPLFTPVTPSCMSFSFSTPSDCPLPAPVPPPAYLSYFPRPGLAGLVYLYLLIYCCAGAPPLHLAFQPLCLNLVWGGLPSPPPFHSLGHFLGRVLWLGWAWGPSAAATG